MMPHAVTDDVKGSQVVTRVTIFITPDKLFRRSFHCLVYILDGNAVYIWQTKLGITYLCLLASGSRLSIRIY